MKPDILYEDNDLIVCIKPAGIPTQSSHTGSGQYFKKSSAHILCWKSPPALPCRDPSSRSACGGAPCICQKPKNRRFPEPSAPIRRIRQTLSGMALRFLTERRGGSDRSSGKRWAFQHLQCLYKRHTGGKRSSSSL